MDNAEKQPIYLLPVKFFRAVRHIIRKTLPGKIVTVLALISFPVFLVLTLEILNYHNKSALFNLISTHKPLFIVSVILMALITLLFFCIFRYAAIVSGLLGVIAVGVGAANYFKFLIRGEPLYPWDFAMAGSVGEVGGFAGSLGPTRYMLFCLLATVLYTVYFSVSGTRLRVPSPIALSCAVCICAQIYTVYTDPVIRIDYMPKLGIYVDATLNQELLYKTAGFIGGFSINIGSLLIDRPDKASQSGIEELMRLYPASEASPDFAYPDVIIILSEAFWDPLLLNGTSADIDPMRNYREIAEESISGNLISSVFGGGTVTTEFEVLTGMTVRNLPIGSYPYQQYVNRETPSVATLLKSLGYYTMGLHTFNASFYNRDKAYPLIGIDHFAGLERLTEHYGELEKKGMFVKDDFFMDELIIALENRGFSHMGDSAADLNQPVFMMGISVQNHGPYGGKYRSTEVNVENPALSVEDLSLLRNFAQGVMDADKNLKKLIDYLKQTDRPTVLLYYGDHLPTLGRLNSVYTSSGFINAPNYGGWTPEECRAMYACPFLIWSNYKEEAGDAGDVSAYYLPSMLLDYIGAPKPPFYNFLSEYQKNVSVYTSRVYSLAGSGTYGGKRSEEALVFADMHWALTYDRLIGRHYSVKGETFDH